MKVLNLYSGIGGNRKLWKDVEVTAVEYNEEIAAIYQEYFPDDKMIVSDAHEYLLKHYKEFDFVWSSFPCTTHTRMNVNFNRVRYADLGLYQEIIFLNTFFNGKFCVENVIPYYGNEGLTIPGVPVQQYHRHLFWANFNIRTTDKRNPPKQIQNIIAQNTKDKRKWANSFIRTTKVSQPHFGFDISKIKLAKGRKDQILRNLVDPEIGLMILEQAQGIMRQEKTSQITLFNNDAA